MNDLITIILFVISVSSGIFGLITNNANFIIVAVVLFLFDMMRREY